MKPLALFNIACAAFLSFGSVARADANTAIEERLSRLEAELGDVKSENRALRQKLSEIEEHASPHNVPKTYPEIRLNVLGSVEYSINNIKNSPNEVSLGDIDLVTTAQLNERASVTSDYVIASNHGGFAYEIERLFVSYRFSDAFNVDFGRFHTAMGWYNNFYHNGTYFQTSRDRPELFLFEDNQGILPVHSTGLSLNGEIPSGSLGLNYSAEISNGREYTAFEDKALQIEDDNNDKALNLQLRMKPDALQNWQFGVGAYHDTLTPVLDPVGAPGATSRIDQLILTGFAIFKTPLLEWFTEIAFVGDRPVGADRSWTCAGYSQVSHRFDKLRPYVRLQWHETDTNDPVMRLIGRNVTSWDSQFGVRYDFTTMMALKFEYEHLRQKDAGSSDELSTQLSFRF